MNGRGKGEREKEGNFSQDMHFSSLMGLDLDPNSHTTTISFCFSFLTHKLGTTPLLGAVVLRIK